jgi:YidC/Oxa1 family membrane protein insertase
MEKRVTLAIVLMIAVVVITNLLFPPSAPRHPPGAAVDSAAVAAGTAAVAGSASTAPDSASTSQGVGAPAGSVAAGSAAANIAAPDTGTAAAGPTPSLGNQGAAETAPGDTIRVRTPLYSLAFDTRGARLVSATLRHYASFASGDSAGRRAELVRSGEHLLSWRVAVGPDTLDLSGRRFEPSATSVRVDSGGGADSLSFRYAVPGTKLVYRVTYRFEPDRYLVDVHGAFEGLGSRGYTVLAWLGSGIRTNEAHPGEDYKHLGYVVNGQQGVKSQGLDDVKPDSVRTPEGAPFRWVAVKDKYFLEALIASRGKQGFGGLLVTGDAAPHTAHMEAALPVPAGQPGFELQSYLGPQEFDRLAAIGQELQNVNPYGWQWLRFIIRPLAGLITKILTWLHNVLGLQYGWVLILFGILMRVVLFPLYQKSMRAQMAQMKVQPLVKELQAKYKDEPEKLQKEMMRVYREHNINPLAGCLPMMLPFPVLITLFFVFENTIEFRGVPFLWLPDLSLQDPLYIIPVAMGLSMFVLQWIGQRGMERNTQMKMMGYAMPVVMTFLFARFPAGLNLYYTTSNLASLPQQWYLARERMEESGGSR